VIVIFICRSFVEEFVMVLLYYSDRSEASGGAAVLGPGVEDCARCAASLD
jgi:hypothetical protein